jgi:hypothetical protein
MSWFSVLPFEIYRILQNFLSSEQSNASTCDYSNLMNCSKSLFSLVKRETIQIKCNTTDSQLLRSVFQRVKDPCQQIRVNIPVIGVNEISFNLILKKTLESALSVGFLSLNLSRVRFSGDLPLFPLRNVRRLYLCCCYGFTDLSGLEDSMIEVLCLEGLSSLQEISQMRQMSYLNKVLISGCDTLINLSPLRGIQEVDITYPSPSSSSSSKEIVDFASFASNHTSFTFSAKLNLCKHLSLSLFHNIQNVDLTLYEIDCDLSCLQDLSGSLRLYSVLPFNFNLISFQGTSLWLINASIIHSQKFFVCCSLLRELKLTNCHNIEFLSSESNEWLTMNHPFRQHLKELILRNCEEITSLSSFGFVPKLEIWKCDSLTSHCLDGLTTKAKGLKQFLIGYCQESIHLNPLKGLSKVCLTGMKEYPLETVLENIYFLEIMYNSLFIDTIVLKNIYHLKIHCCLSIQSSKNVKNVSIIEFSKCVNLENIDNLGEEGGGAKSVSVKGCPKISDLYKSGRYNETLKRMIPKFMVMD